MNTFSHPNCETLHIAILVQPRGERKKSQGQLPWAKGQMLTLLICSWPLKCLTTACSRTKKNISDHVLAQSES
jgi:hypothetical protein